jgi:hypothetical protein
MRRREFICAQAIIHQNDNVTGNIQLDTGHGARWDKLGLPSTDSRAHVGTDHLGDASASKLKLTSLPHPKSFQYFHPLPDGCNSPPTVRLRRFLLRQAVRWQGAYYGGRCHETSLIESCLEYLRRKSSLRGDSPRQFSCCIHRAKQIWRCMVRSKYLRLNR